MKYLSIEREFLDFPEFGFVQSRDICGLAGYFGLKRV